MSYCYLIFKIFTIYLLFLLLFIINFPKSHYFNLCLIYPNFAIFLAILHFLKVSIFFIYEKIISLSSIIIPNIIYFVKHFLLPQQYFLHHLHRLKFTIIHFVFTITDSKYLFLQKILEVFIKIRFFLMIFLILNFFFIIIIFTFNLVIF